MSNLIIDIAGNRRWVNSVGQLHRVDGPALEFSVGTKQWYIKGSLHRIDGPAIEGTNGYKAWYVNDKCHRLYGPAVEYSSGTHDWYVDGVNVHEKDYPEAVLLYKCKQVLES